MTEHSDRVLPIPRYTAQQKREEAEEIRRFHDNIWLSSLYCHRYEIGTLDRRFVLLCEYQICAALLLEKFYSYSYWAIEKTVDDQEDYFDPAIYNTVQGMADWFVGLFEASQIEEALHYLINKRYIITKQAASGEWTIECDMAVVEEECKTLKLQIVPIHTLQHCSDEEQKRTEWRGRFRSHPTETAKIERKKPLDNEEQKKVDYHNKRARNAKLPATLTLEQWIETLNHFKWKCAYCCGKYNLLEHFIPLNHGKGTTWDNCVPACHGCNSKKQAWNPLNGWGPELTSIKEGIERVQVYLATRVL